MTDLELTLTNISHWRGL